MNQSLCGGVFILKSNSGNVVIEYVLVLGMIALLSVSNLDALEGSIGNFIDALSGAVDDVTAQVS